MTNYLSTEQETVVRASESDEALLAKSLTDPRVFNELIDRYQEALLSKARYILRDDQDAKDVVQDTLVKIYLHAPKFKVQKNASFKSWIYKILLNTCFSFYQKKKLGSERLVIVDPELLLLMDKGETESVERKLDLDFISSIIARLPGVLRTISKRYFIDGLSYEDLAQEEGVPVGAIRTRIHRAKKELKKFESLLAY